MKDTAPISLGILAVAAIFGLIAGGVSFVMYGFGFVAALLIAGLIALLVIVVLGLGWRDPAPSLQASNAAGKAALAAVQAKGAPTAPAAKTAAEQSPAAAARAAKAMADAEAAQAKASADAKAASDKAAADAKAAAVPAPAAVAEEKAEGDATAETPSAGKRPEALKGPIDGKADNLKEIKGIGPKLEKLCNSLGFYHFDQIAKWTPEEVAWVDDNLEGFKGRVTRDTWVAQAKILAAGGDTEFSKRVEDGDVY